MNVSPDAQRLEMRIAPGAFIAASALEKFTARFVMAVQFMSLFNPAIASHITRARIVGRSVITKAPGIGVSYSR